MRRIWVILLLASAVRGADVTLLTAASVGRVTLFTTGAAIVENSVRLVAMDRATRIFSPIDVRLHWKTKKAVPAANTLLIEVRFTLEMRGHPGVMGFATPFDPNPVVIVMYDRILDATKSNPSMRAAVLAHVLAHEIGHVLMKTTDHSADGVMKAYWSIIDYTRMARGSLRFLPEDVFMIRNGLALSSGIPVLNPPTVPPRSPTDEKF